MIQRANERFNADYKYKGRLLFFGDVRIKNISSGGVCIETSQRIYPNSVCRIEIANSNNEKKTLISEVVWSLLKRTFKDMDNVLPVYEVGLKFADLNDDEKIFLDTIILEVSGSPTPLFEKLIEKVN